MIKQVKAWDLFCGHCDKLLPVFFRTRKEMREFKRFTMQMKPNEDWVWGAYKGKLCCPECYKKFIGKEVVNGDV